MITEKPPEQLAHEDIMRQTLELAARRLEALGGNYLYVRAYRLAANWLRKTTPSELTKY